MDRLAPPENAVSGGGNFAEKPGRIASLVGACSGLAAAWLLAGLVPSRPPKDPLPGFAGVHGLDLRREVLLFVLTVALTLAGGAIAARMTRRRPVGKPVPPTPHELPPEARTVSFGLAAVCAHAIAAWIFAVSGFPALAGSGGGLATLLLGSWALAWMLGGGRLDRGVVFLGAASPLLILAFLGQRPIPFARAAAVAAFVLPALVWAPWRREAEAPRWLRRLTIGVLLPGSFTALAAAAVLGVPPVADLFEDGHALLPASEYLRGELPYRDFVPGHGIVSDGLFDAASLRLFGDDYRGYSRGRKLLGALFWPSFFAIGFAATGSPAAGLWALALSFLCFPQYAFPRVIASLATVAIAAFASRTGKRWAWRVCGAALPLDACVSLDFAIYAAAAAVTALIVARGDRRAHARAGLAGMLGATAVILALLAAFGILQDFVRTTVLFLPTLFPVYAKGFFPVFTPPGEIEIGSIPVAALYGAAALALVLLATQLPRGARVSAGARAALPVLAWIVLAMLSVVERRHFGYLFFAIPTALVLVARWFRTSGRAGPWRTLVAGAAVGAFAWLHSPIEFVHVISAAIQNSSFPPHTLPLDQPRRARGALFQPNDRTLILRTAEMMRRADFRDGDTWLDFANEPALYFLFDRPCPIRYYEVPFYESQSAQEEVIDAVSRNPHVRAVLVAAVYPEIDLILNADRAPRVHEFLRQHFHPFMREDNIEFWLRDPQSNPSLDTKNGP
ncbi:MAG: hypothetical protein ABI968_07465 [Acidobacteriota bacterium]